jgi:hypothetical protein
VTDSWAESHPTLDIQRVEDIPDDLVLTGFETGDPMVQLFVL